MNTETMNITDEGLSDSSNITLIDAGDTDNSGGQEEEGNTCEADGQVLQSMSMTTEQSDELEGTSPGEIAESIGATKTQVLAGIWHLAQNAVKHVVVDGQVEEIQNDAVRLESLKTLSKFHFGKEFQAGKRNKKLKVILVQ